MKRSFTAGMFTLLFVAGMAWALGPVDLNVELDANTRYLWRAIPLSTGPVVQPSASVGINDFSLSAWGNVPLTDSGVSGSLNELDLGLTYTRTLLGIELEPSISYYLYPGALSENTAEADLNVSLPIGPITPYTLQTLDFLHTRGAYYGTLGLTYTHDLLLLFSGTVDLSAAWANARFNEANMGVAKSTLNSATLGLSFEFDPLEIFYVRLNGTVNQLLDKELRSAAGSDATTWSAGLAVGVNL